MSKTRLTSTTVGSVKPARPRASLSAVMRSSLRLVSTKFRLFKSHVGTHRLLSSALFAAVTKMCSPGDMRELRGLTASYERGLTHLTCSSEHASLRRVMIAVGKSSRSDAVRRSSRAADSSAVLMEASVMARADGSTPLPGPWTNVILCRIPNSLGFSKSMDVSGSLKSSVTNGGVVMLRGHVTCGQSSWTLEAI